MRVGAAMENLPVPPVPLVPPRDWKPDWLKAGITENGILKTDPPGAAPLLVASGQTHALSDGGEGESQTIESLTIPADPMAAYRLVYAHGCQLNLVEGKVRVSGPEAAVAAVRPVVVAHRDAIVRMLTPNLNAIPFNDADLSAMARVRTHAEAAVYWLIDLGCQIEDDNFDDDFREWLDGAVRLGSDRAPATRDAKGFRVEPITPGKWMPVRSTAKALLNLLVTRWATLRAESKESLVRDIEAFYVACGGSGSKSSSGPADRSWRSAGS